MRILAKQRDLVTNQKEASDLFFWQYASAINMPLIGFSLYMSYRFSRQAAANPARKAQLAMQNIMLSLGIVAWVITTSLRASSVEKDVAQKYLGHLSMADLERIESD